MSERLREEQKAESGGDCMTDKGTEHELIELAERGAAELGENASAEDLLRWTD